MIAMMTIVIADRKDADNYWPWLLVLTRAVESESREVGKSLKIGKNRIKSDKIGKIGSDFLSDFLAKMPKCHKLP